MDKTDAIKNGKTAMVSLMLKIVKSLVSSEFGLGIFLHTIIFKGVNCIVLLVG